MIKKTNKKLLKHEEQQFLLIIKKLHPTSLFIFTFLINNNINICKNKVFPQAQKEILQQLINKDTPNYELLIILRAYEKNHRWINFIYFLSILIYYRYGSTH